MLIAGGDIGKPIMIVPTPSGGGGGECLCVPVFVIQIKSDIIVPETNNRRKLIRSFKVVKGPTIPPNITTKFWTPFSCIEMKCFQNEGVLKEALLWRALVPYYSLSLSASNFSFRTHQCNAGGPLVANLTEQAIIFSYPSFQPFLSNLLLPSTSVSTVPFPELAKW